MHTGGGRGGREGTSCNPYKDFFKLPHKDAIKMTPPPLIFSQPQVPPSKEFAKKLLCLGATKGSICTAKGANLPNDEKD